MQTKLIEKQPTSASFEVTVPAAEVSSTYERVLASVSRQLRLPGFRPGKAPRGVVIKRVGEDALAQELRDALVEANYPKALRELELTPVHVHFHAHEPQLGDDYRFEVHVELYPEFDLPDLSEIIIDTEAPSVNEEMVAAAVAELQREHATLVPVERPAQAGDYLLVESLGEDGPSGNVLPIDLERVSPALAEQLLGRTIGEEITLRLEQDEPEDDEDEDDAEGYDETGADGGDAEAEAEEAAEEGTEATEDGVSDGVSGSALGANGATETTAVPSAERPSLRVLVKDIKEKEKPAPDDEFAKTLGFETWDEVLAQVRTNLRLQLEADAFEAQREEFVDKLVAETDPTPPASLIERRKANLLANLERDLRSRKLTLQGYLESLPERESFERELQTTAEGAVRRDLVLERLLEERGTSVSDAELSEALRYLASRQGQDVAKLRREMGESGLENYRFLLARDKAVREALRERLGQPLEDAQDIEDASEDAPEDDASGPADDPADAKPPKSEDGADEGSS